MAGVLVIILVINFCFLACSGDQSETWNTNLILPQTSGFSGINVTSGPVVIIDKRTFFISSFHFNGYPNDTQFWAGKTDASSTSGFQVPDEQNSMESLRGYSGEDIRIQFPAEISLDDVDYLAVRPSSGGKDLALIHFDQSIRKLVEERESDLMGDNEPFLVPICCKNKENCKSHVFDNVPFTLPVYSSNATHIDPETIQFPYPIFSYFYPAQCGPGENSITLDPGFETFGLIYNASLILKAEFANDIYHHEKFCIWQDAKKNMTQVAFCATSPNMASMPDIYLPLLVISMICFALSAICYWFLLKVRDVHRVCFVAYSTSMFVTFLMLIILQTISDDTSCRIVGSIFVFASIASFAWLAILSFDLIYIVRYFKGPKWDGRIYWYCGLACGTAFLVILLSLFINSAEKPNVPKSFIKQYSQNFCYFEDSNIAIFFVSIGLLILTTVVSLVLVFHYIRTFDTNFRNEYDWLSNRNNFKFLLRSYTVIITLVNFWLMEVVYNEKVQQFTQLALDLIEASLGVVTLIIFVLNRYTRRELKQIYSRYRKIKPDITALQLELNDLPTPPMTPDTEIDRQFPGTPVLAQMSNMSPGFQLQRLISINGSKKWLRTNSKQE